VTEDLTVYLADWGEEGTIDAVPVFGIFSEPGGVDGLSGTGMVTSYPRFLLPASTVPARAGAADADQVLELPLRLVAGKPWRFYVRTLTPDGTTLEGGMASLELAQHEDQEPSIP
jgi:hypothetical protein